MVPGAGALLPLTLAAGRGGAPRCGCAGSGLRCGVAGALEMLYKNQTCKRGRDEAPQRPNFRTSRSAARSPPHTPAPTRPRSALGPACELSLKTSALYALRSACSRGEALALRAGPPVLGLAVIEQLHHLLDRRYGTRSADAKNPASAFRIRVAVGLGGGGEVGLAFG
eukprot:scaffold69979_cov69-Phaeocystis_antarctica.AAC.3